MNARIPVTVFVATKNEEANIGRCLTSLRPAARVLVLDSGSTDLTSVVAREHQVEVIQFEYRGGYPKKRQWALDHVPIDTPWVLLLDADEVIPAPLWEEIRWAIRQPEAPDAFLITKQFHFLGKALRFGHFSHQAVALFRRGSARFERLFDDSAAGLDMEVHERVIVNGTIGRLAHPLMHNDFKGLEAYIAKHNKYSTWEAQLRFRAFSTGRYGTDTITPTLFGDTQQRRRALKKLVVRIPFEHWLWFCYHYFLRLGILDGTRGLIASRLRAGYIMQVRAKLFELRTSEGPEQLHNRSP